MTRVSVYWPQILNIIRTTLGLGCHVVYSVCTVVAADVADPAIFGQDSLMKSLFRPSRLSLLARTSLSGSLPRSGSVFWAVRFCDNFWAPRL